MIAKDTAAKNRTDIIRAGATYPSAVPASYFQVSSSLQHPHPGTTATALTKYFPPDTRPRPAFGATRYEGAALSHPHADIDTAANHCRRRGQSAGYPKRCAGIAGNAALMASLALTAAKGPTARTIISTTASGQKPPLPDEEQIRRQRRCLLEISEANDAAVSDGRKRTVRSISLDIDRSVGLITDKIPGYHQTWGVAFSGQEYTPHAYPTGPGEVSFSQNYTPGTVQRR